MSDPTQCPVCQGVINLDNPLPGHETHQAKGKSVSMDDISHVLEGIRQYQEEYLKELESCDRWIRWCDKHEDIHGQNFHQGKRSALVFNNICQTKFFDSVKLMLSVK